MDRWKATTGKPALEPPLILADVENQHTPARLTVVAVVKRALPTRSGYGTVTVVVEQSVLFVSSVSITALVESTFAQTW